MWRAFLRATAYALPTSLFISVALVFHGGVEWTFWLFSIVVLWGLFLVPQLPFVLFRAGQDRARWRRSAGR